MKFNFVKLPELDFDLKSVTTDSGRKYVTPSGNSYPSVTTVLSSYNKKAIMEWRQRVGEQEANKIARRASNRGTKLHLLCEDYIKGNLSEMRMQTMMPLDKMMFRQMRPLIDQHINNIYCQEQALYSDNLEIAGRVDLIAEWDGVLSIIDYKSSTKMKNKDNIKNYFMQCSAYAEMFGEITGININNIVVMIATEEETPQVFIEDKDNYLESLRFYIQKHKGQ